MTEQIVLSYIFLAENSRLLRVLSYDLSNSRKQLEKEYGCDLTEHKKFIDKSIMELIDEMGG